MSDEKPMTTGDWRCRGWADHQTSRFDATYGSTLLERLRWLESAADFARRLGPATAPDASGGRREVAEAPEGYLPPPHDDAPRG